MFVSALTTIDGTASGSNVDYYISNPTIDFPPEESEGCITVHINEDREDEGDEDFIVKLDSSTGGFLPLMPIETQITITNSGKNQPSWRQQISTFEHGDNMQSHAHS